MVLVFWLILDVRVCFYVLRDLRVQCVADGGCNGRFFGGY